MSGRVVAARLKVSCEAGGPGAGVPSAGEGMFVVRSLRPTQVFQSPSLSLARKDEKNGSYSLEYIPSRLQ